MVAAYRDGATVENGRTATTTTATVTIPAAAQPGDVAVVGLIVNASSGTFTTPAGWTVLSGPDRVPSSSTSGFLFAKKLLSGDPGTSVNFVYADARRIVGAIGVASGVTLTGAVVALATEASTTTTTVLPIAGGVPAGAMVFALWERRSSSTPATITVPAPLTAGPQSKTAYSSSTNWTAALGYQVAGGAGSYGGQSAASSPATLGLNYVVALPAEALGAATVTGVTATVAVTAPAGAASALSTVTGQTPVVSVTAAAGAVSAGTEINSTVAGATATITARANPGVAIVPAFGITVTPEPGNSPPRVRIDILDDRSAPATSVVVARLDADGRLNRVRTSDDGPLPISGGTATLYDYEAPYGTTVTYSTDVTSGTVSAVLDAAEAWLVHIGVPSRSVRLTSIFALGEDERPTSSGLFQILERNDPIAISSGARPSAAAVLGVRTRTEVERRAMHLLLDDDSPVLLNLPATQDWGVDTGYMSIRDVRAPRTVRVGSVPLREWTLPYQTIGRPVGGNQAAITWDDIALRGADDYTAAAGSQYLTWQAIADAGVTSWAELAAPTG